MSSQGRPLAEFSPSIWGDRFISIPRDFEMWRVYSEERDALKNEVKRMFVSAGGKWTDKLILINIVERLGVSYHFYEYIEEKLAELHNANEKAEENYDLFTTSLYFRIFRQHGYNVSSDIFNKYKEIDGKFSEDISKDPVGMLSLYEATHLRIRGEVVLDEALAFTTSHLKSMIKTMESGSLARQVKRALEQPLHKGIPRIEAKQFISFYEEDLSKDEVLLKFAKLDFNLVQMLYRQELSQVARWWADLDFDSKLPQFRSRVVEGYLWAVGNLFEPSYSLARIMYAKMVCVLSVADDLYDAYGTMDELDIYTKAIERLDVESIDGLPYHCKMCYVTCLNVFHEFDEELIKHGRYYDVSYLKNAFKANLRAYHKEATWCDKKYVPPLEEYYANGAASSGICMLGVSIILGMGHDAVQACEWAIKKPKAVVAAETMGRIINDIVGYEEEHKRPHVATSIDCYIKEHGVSKEEAIVRLYEKIETTWEDINEACLRPKLVPGNFVSTFLQLMRVCHVTYNNADGYTHPEKLLEHEINYMFMDPIPI